MPKCARVPADARMFHPFATGPGHNFACFHRCASTQPRTSRHLHHIGPFLLSDLFGSGALAKTPGWHVLVQSSNDATIQLRPVRLYSVRATCRGSTLPQSTRYAPTTPFDCACRHFDPMPFDRRCVKSALFSGFRWKVVALMPSARNLQTDRAGRMPHHSLIGAAMTALHRAGLYFASGRTDKATMRRLIALLLIPSFLLSQAAGLSHTHAGVGGGEPADHATRPHFHVHGLSGKHHHHHGDHAEHHHRHGADHHRHGSTGVPPSAALFPVAEHDADAVYAAGDVVALSRRPSKVDSAEGRFVAPAVDSMNATGIGTDLTGSRIASSATAREQCAQGPLYLLTRSLRL